MLRKNINNIIKVTLLLVFTVILLSTSTLAEVTVGGEAKIAYSGMYSDNGNHIGKLSESLDFELFLPSYGDTDFKVHFVVSNYDKEDIWDIPDKVSFKKLNLRHKFDDFYLTVGRQPISWSFGSLLNPVDYTLGAIALDEETMGKYQDGIEFYYPINWNSGLEVIATDIENSDSYKWGVRGRTGFKGYDLTVNYVKEPAGNSLLNILPLGHLVGASGNTSLPTTSIDRIGLTAKGDLGSIGAYTALGYYKKDGISKPSYSYLIGGDYSFTYDYYKKINLQIEVLALQDEQLIKMMENYLGMSNIGSTLDLMVGTLSYPIDDFSSISLFTISSLDDGSTVFTPIYENQLPGNIKLSLSTSLFVSDDDKFLSGKGVTAGYELALSYAF